MQAVTATTSTEYLIATGLSNSAHNITLIKSSDHTYGVTEFFGYGLASGMNILSSLVCF